MTDRRHRDDAALAAACSRGDEDAWREFRERYFDFIRQFARRFVNERAAADVSDQVIADLWQRQRIAQYDGRSSLRTWLGAVVAHAAINAGKSERRLTPLDPTALDRPAAHNRRDATSPEDEQTRRVFTGLMEWALGEIDREGRLLLQLYYEQELTLDDMESVMGASKATLSRRLEKLRRSVRDAVEARAQQELRISADTLRERLDFARLELDLAAVLGRPVKGKGDGAV